MIKRGFALESAAAPEFVGSVTKQLSDVSPGFDTTSPMDISSLDIQAGDIGIIAFSFGFSPDYALTWAGDIDFTQLVNNTHLDTPGGYVGYATLDGTETEIATSGISVAKWDNLAIVFSVFRNVSYVNDITWEPPTYTTNALTSPDLDVTAGSIVVVTAHLDDDSVTFSAPTNYTLAGEQTRTGVSTAIAYRTDHSTGTESPGVWPGSPGYGDDGWACTLELTQEDNRTYKLMDTKTVTITDATSFDAAGDFDISGLDFQSGDMAFINIMSDEGGISSYSWGGDVDFIELNNDHLDAPPHYQGYAILDGTETDIHLTTGFTSQLQGGIIQLGIFRGPTYPANASATTSGTIGTPGAPALTNNTPGNMQISLGLLDDDAVDLYPCYGEQREFSVAKVNTGVYACSSGISWRTVGPEGKSHGASYQSTGDDAKAGKTYEFQETKPAAATVNLIGTTTWMAANASSVDTYAEGIDLPGSFQTGDYLVVTLASSQDPDSDFFFRVAGLSGSQDTTSIYHYSTSGFISKTAYLEINTTTLGSSPRLYLVSGATNVDNHAGCIAIFRGPTGFIAGGNTNNSSGMPQTVQTSDWIQRGNLLVSVGGVDDGVAHTAPTGFTQAVTRQNGGSSSCSINYKTDFETGDFAGGDVYGGGGSGIWTASTFQLKY